MSDAADRTFAGPEPVCVHESGNAFGSGANDCTDAGGQADISGVRVGDSANSITIDTVGANKVGVLSVGTGTHETTLDGSNGNVNVAGTLNIQLQGGLTVDPLNNNINFGGNAIHGIGTPLSGTDAANKAYVDTAVANVANGGDRTFDTVTVNGATQTASLTVVHDASVGGKLTVTDITTMNGGAVVNNGLTVTGGTTTDSLTVTGNSNVQGNQTVTGQSFLNGGATVSNNFTVTPGTSVDMGGNRVQNVGAPVLGTDAANKAYVDAGLGSANHRIDKAFEGTAIALSLATPIFQPGQKFVIQGGWGGFEGTNAFGFSAAGLLARDVFGPGSTVTVSGGVGAGTEDGTVAGRAAVSVGW
ncbi:MAG TPA: hypothetical protein VGF29_15190 [Hyphomicrobiaceae bacterium]